MEYRDEFIYIKINNVSYEQCEDCGEFTSELSTCMVASGEIICEKCRENYICCENCEEVYHEDEINFVEKREQFLCDYCW